MFAAIVRHAAIPAGALLAAVAVGHAAGAQTPRPNPSPMPTTAAFSAHAHANVTVVTQGTTFSGSLQLGVAQRANLTRIDILSVKSDTIPIPPIVVTAVLDRGANTLTVWNDTTKQYRVQPFLPRPAASATPRPRASARPARSGTSPFKNLEVLEATIKLTGHTTTAGVATTGMSFDLQVRSKNQQGLSHVTATTQLADDYAVFPMTLDVSLEPGGAAPFNAKLSYAVDDLTPGSTGTTSFSVPAGYTEASSLAGVLFAPRRPTASPAPTPKPR
jgi:hypothetical protein